MPRCHRVRPMLTPPFSLVRCSWPRAVEFEDRRWTSEPEWSAPWMPYAPRPRWQWVNGELCWTIDWCQFFSDGVPTCGGRPGQMRGFHVIFELLVAIDGDLVFWDDDGSIIRRDGRVVHADRGAHPLQRHSLHVQPGDRLQVAQWQLRGGWLWGARINRSRAAALASQPDHLLATYLLRVSQRLQCPNGPALKVFTHGRSPLRLAVAIYSCILNGYAPAGVYLFGEHQWRPQDHVLIARLLSFAKIVPTGDLLGRVRALGQPALAQRAVQHWYILKACVSLFSAPAESCCMDDDVFALGSFDDALTAFTAHNLVFAPDIDNGDNYRATWPHLIGDERPLPTARFNAGLYWMRVDDDPRVMAAAAAPVLPTTFHHWEQGLIAGLYSRKSSFELPSRRYFYPAFDGLPGGTLGYDYANNPCQFASIHFGATQEKPTDADAAMLLDELLADRTEATASDTASRPPST